MGVHLKETPLTFRRKNKHPLDKLLKELIKETPEALGRLVALSESKDEKIALTATKAILEFTTGLSATIDKDDITRTLAEIKMCGPKQLEMVDEDDTPQIDFNEIQDV